MQSPGNVLVFHTAFIGDIVLTLPLVQTLRERWPKCNIGFVAIPSVAPVLAGHPAVNDVVVYDKKHRDAGFRGILSMARTLRGSHYEVALVPHRSLRSALVVRLARIPVRIGFDTSTGRLLLTDTVRYIPEIHEVERNLRLLEPLGIHVSGGVLPVLVPGQADRDRVDEVLSHHRADHPRFDYENMIAVAPGSVWNTKRWPKENFIGLIALLVEEGYSIVLVGGDDDASLCGEIEDIAGEGAILNAAGRLSLLQSAELLRRCKVAVSNDSAPMHLACAVRTPVVVIFGATVPQFGFGPLGAHDLVVETLGLTCRPCSIHGGDACPIRTFICMKQITPHQVFEKVRSITSRVTIRT